MIPIPPSSAKAIAILDSVTVSIAEEIIGMFMLRFFVRRVVKSTLLGKTSE
jgi:hypothetical protein